MISDESTKNLYQRRLEQRIERNKTLETDNVETSWEKIKTNIIEAAEEAIGKRKCSSSGIRSNTPWFKEEIRTLAEEKRNAYLKYRNKTTTYEDYRQIRNKVNKEIRQIKRGYREKFSADMEHDLYGAQKKVWNMLRNRRKHVNESVQIAKIPTDEWEKHFMELYKDRTTTRLTTYARRRKKRHQVITLSRLKKFKEQQTN